MVRLHDLAGEYAHDALQAQLQPVAPQGGGVGRQEVAISFGLRARLASSTLLPQIWCTGLRSLLPVPLACRRTSSAKIIFLCIA